MKKVYMIMNTPLNSPIRTECIYNLTTLVLTLFQKKEGVKCLSSYLGNYLRYQDTSKVVNFFPAAARIYISKKSWIFVPLH